MTSAVNENAVRKRDIRIIFICWLAYTAAYVGRLNYNASIVALIADLGVTKAEAGLVSSFFFFAYGAGQLVNGILSKKYNAKIMIFFHMRVFLLSDSQGELAPTNIITNQSGHLSQNFAKIIQSSPCWGFLYQ